MLKGNNDLNDLQWRPSLTKPDNFIELKQFLSKFKWCWWVRALKMHLQSWWMFDILWRICIVLRLSLSIMCSGFLFVFRTSRYERIMNRLRFMRMLQFRKIKINCLWIELLLGNWMTCICLRGENKGNEFSFTFCLPVICTNVIVYHVSALSSCGFELFPSLFLFVNLIIFLIFILIILFVSACRVNPSSHWWWRPSYLYLYSLNFLFLVYLPVLTVTQWGWCTYETIIFYTVLNFMKCIHCFCFYLCIIKDME